MARVITFGEIMLRLSTPNYQRFVQTDSFNVTYGGAEANVACSLANYGVQAVFVSKVPANPLGQAAINYLRRFGVDTSYVLRDGERLGIYFLEVGFAQRPSNVIYDRKHSSITTVYPGEFDWDQIFSNSQWFHFTGITPALGKNVAEVTLEAARKAKEKGLTVSCDLNYRQKLWSLEEANEIMGRIMPYVDVIIGNEEHLRQVFQIDVGSPQADSEEFNRKIAEEIYRRFGLQRVVITFRENVTTTVSRLWALMYDGVRFYQSRQYEIHILEGIGGGDAFASGVIYGLMENVGPQEVLEFALSACCLKHTIPGDFNHVTREEVLSYMNNKGAGRVQR
ncbi:sugar kinase [Moorellaceae bacterium AZ2]